MLSVSNKRLKEFLAAEELDPSVVKRVASATAKQSAVEIDGGVFSWEEGKTSLRDVNLSVGKGQLVCSQSIDHQLNQSINHRWQWSVVWAAVNRRC